MWTAWRQEPSVYGGYGYHPGALVRDGTCRKLLKAIARDFPARQAWAQRMELEMVLGSHAALDDVGVRVLVEHFTKTGVQTFELCVVVSLRSR